MVQTDSPFFAFPMCPGINTEELPTIRRESEGWWRLVLDVYAVSNRKKAC